MTKEELEKEAEEYALKQWEGNIPWGVIQKAYYDSAEPREKEIKSLGERCLQLQKDKGELTDRVRELEAQIEKMKSHSNCKHRSEYNEFDPYSKVCQSCCNLEKWEFGR